MDKTMEIEPDHQTASSLCRLCAVENDDMFPIFDPAGNKTEISQQIRDCLPMVAWNGDAVSKLICRLCKENLQKLHKFWSNVLRANGKFRDSENARKSQNMDKNLFDMQFAATIEDDDDTEKKFTSLSCLVCSACNEVFLDGQSSAGGHRNCPYSAGDANDGIRTIVLNSVCKCEFCDRCYVDAKSVNIHKASHVADKPYVCLTCNMYYSTYKQVTTHKAEHRTSTTAATAKDAAAISKYFSCRHCDKIFMHFRNMNVHQKCCLSGDQWKCRHCANCFTDSKGLIDHTTSEVNTKWQCQRCPMSFGSLCALRRHKKKPHAKRYVCSDCGKPFLQKTHLAIHMRSHTGEKPFPCDLCDKLYRNKSERDNHRKTHMGERPFKCSQCDKSFVNSARLREHAKFHKDPKPFKCTVCDKGFKRFSARKIHMTIHTGEKAFKCEICNRAFKRKTDLRKHKKTRHEVACRTVAVINR